VTEGQPTFPPTHVFSPNTSDQNFEQVILFSIAERGGKTCLTFFVKKSSTIYVKHSGNIECWTKWKHTMSL